MKRTGFFGGSFDPIHLGHLNLAIEIAERHKLDEVFVVPTSQSPHKKETPPKASKEHRRAMTTAAISPLPQFTLLDFELQKTIPCYTIDTIEALIEMDKNRQYFLMMGEDSFEQLHTWKDVDRLLKLAPPLIGSRTKKTKEMTSIPLLDISSTNIRARIHKGLYCGHLLPAKVWDYIQQHQLYRN